MMRRRYLLPLLLCALAAGSRGFALDHTTDSLETVKKNLEEKKAILVDVREQDEWDAGHLAAARLVPMSKLEATGAPADLPKDTILYGHCRAGVRALKAAAILQKAGYDFRPLKEGYADLAEAGFPKADSAEKPSEKKQTEAKDAGKAEAPGKDDAAAKAKAEQNPEKPEQKAAQNAQDKNNEKSEKSEKAAADDAGAAPRSAAELPPCCR